MQKAPSNNPDSKKINTSTGSDENKDQTESRVKPEKKDSNQPVIKKSSINLD
jgi:hypothetical protein